MKAMKKLIKGGTVVTDKEVFHGDIVIDDEKIAALSPAIDDREAEVIDAAGMYVIPGGVDIHTHMSLDAGIARSIDDFYTGTRAAACGGTTTIIDHMAFGPERCSLWRQVEEYHKLADGRAVTDYGFHGVLQHVDDQILSEMGEIARKEGITTFKAYMTYDRRLDDRALMRVLAAAKRKGITIAVHCENDGMIGYFTEKFVRAGHRDAAYHPLSRPAAAEAEAVNRLLYLAEASGEAPVYIVHLSSAAGLAELEAAQARGQRHIGAETCTQYLLLTDEAYVDPREGLKAIMSPPLRKRGDNEALWSAMQREKILTVATDHCPFTFADQKQQGAADFTKCPNGAQGVEERVNLLFSEGVVKGRLTLPQFVRLVSTNPAKVSGIYPRKGVLQPGSDADIVLINPEKAHTLSVSGMHGASDYTLYEGRRVRGKIELVMLRGRVIAKGGRFTGAEGNGKYLRRDIGSIAAEENTVQK